MKRNHLLARIILSLVLPATFALSASAEEVRTQNPAETLSSGSSGTRGGGRAVETGGKYALSDLVDDSVCVWTPGDEFISNVSYLPKALDALADTHWYLAALIKRDLSAANICVAGKLKQIPRRSDDGLTIYRMKTEQVAIRDGDNIYVDKSIYEKMDEVHQGYLFIHESMHSLIPLDVFDRDNKISSFVATIRSNEIKRMSKRQFALQIKMNQVQVIDTTDEIEAYKNAILDLIQGNPQASGTLKSARAVQQISQVLNKRDQEKMSLILTSMEEKISHAVANQQPSFVLSAIRDGYDPNSRFDSKCRNGGSCNHDDYNSQFLLYRAGAKVAAAIIDLPGVQGHQIAFEKAVRECNKEKASLFLTWASPELKDYNLLESIIRCSDPDLLKGAIKRFGDTLISQGRFSERGENILHVLVRKKKLELLKLLLATGKLSVNQQNDFGLTPLMVAVEPQFNYTVHPYAEFDFSGRSANRSEKATMAEIVEALLSTPGIDVNSQVTLDPKKWNSGMSDGKEVYAEEGNTALMYAASKGHLEAVKLLLSIPGINPHLKSNRHGYSALTFAENRLMAISSSNHYPPYKDEIIVLERQSEIVRLLKEAMGIRENARDSEQKKGFLDRLFGN